MPIISFTTTALIGGLSRALLIHSDNTVLVHGAATLKAWNGNLILFVEKVIFCEVLSLSF